MEADQGDEERHDVEGLDAVLPEDAVAERLRVEDACGEEDEDGDERDGDEIQVDVVAPLRGLGIGCAVPRVSIRRLWRDSEDGQRVRGGFLDEERDWDAEREDNGCIWVGRGL